MLKKNIRTLFLKKRLSYTNNYIEHSSNLIKNNLFKKFDFNKINLLHIYLPIIKKKEINTFLIIDDI